LGALGHLTEQEAGKSAQNSGALQQVSSFWEAESCLPGQTNPSIVHCGKCSRL